MIKNLYRELKHIFDHRCIVLCYHRVGDDISDKWGNSVTVDNFRSHMRIVRKYFNPISINTLFDSLDRKFFPYNNCVIITFDDGYEINSEYAYKILDEYEIPATFYVNTYQLENNEYFWWDNFQNIFYLNNYEDNKIILNKDGISLPLSLHDSSKKENSLFILHRILKSLHAPKRFKLLENFCERIGSINKLSDDYKPITEEGIKKLQSNNLFTIGGHSHSHCSLGLIDEEVMSIEIKDNKRILENILKVSIEHFSYPFGGGADYNSSVINIVNNLGYKTAVTTARKACRLESDKFQIPRFSIKNIEEAKFREKLSNYFYQ